MPLTVTSIKRYRAANVVPGQPDVWTLLEFEFDDADSERLASALAAVLDEPLWYVDWQTKQECFVVFAEHVFRYRRGDADARAAVEAFGRERGLPASQLDWPE